MSDHSSASSSNIVPQMIGVEEIKIYLGNTMPTCKRMGHYIFIKLEYKKRQFSANQSILCARYELNISITHHQTWIFNFIIPNDLITIPEFLQDFAREFIITDRVYIAAGLHHKCQFQNQIDYDQIDKASVELRAIFKRRMESKNIIILEDDDLLITPFPPNMNTDFHVDLSQFRFKPAVHISMS